MSTALAYVENDQIHLPTERRAITHEFKVGEHEGRLTVGLYEDGRPGEIRLAMGAQGSTISGLLSALSVTASLCLQHGVPLHALVDKLAYAQFEPQGFTGNRNIPIAKSVVDYAFRWMDRRFKEIC